MKKSILLLSIIVLAACSKTENLFDKEKVKEEAKKNFPVQNIDSNHDWNMADIGTLIVSINQNSGDTYTVKVYTDNPLTSENTAKLMAKEEGVKDGETITLKFDMPSAMQYVYVMKEDSKYNRSIRMVDMFSDNPVISWGTQANKASYIKSRSIERDYIKPDNSIFPMNIPDGAIKYSNSLESNKSYSITGKKQISLQWITNSSLYVKGEVTFTGNQLPNNNKIYILEGSKVRFTDNLQLFAGAYISIAPGANVEFDSAISETGSLYNKGTVSMKKVVANGTFYMYNDGKCLVSEGIYLTNAASIANLGSLNADKIIQDSDTSIFNEAGAIMTIEDELKSDNSNCLLKNNGTFMSESIQTSGGYAIINKCKMLIEEEVQLGGSNVLLDGEAYLKCESLKLLNTTITLGSKAMLVCEEAKISSNNMIEGIGSSNALLYIDDEVEKESGGLCMTYAGNLSIVCTPAKHFGNKGEIHYILKDLAEMRDKKEFEILSDFSGCAPGFIDNKGNESGKPEKIQVYTFAFEDITVEAGDYDFNDVVLKVSTVPVGGKLKVSLVAAGATKNLKVFYENIPLFGGKEVHEALGEASGVMIGTGKGPAGVVAKDSIDWDSNKQLKSNGNFYILDVQTGITVKIPKFDSDFNAGDPPYAIMVPDDWDFPTENQQVINKYPAFEGWAKNATNDVTWYSSNN